MIFIFKKIITFAIVPPGIFILVLIAAGLWTGKRLKIKALYFSLAALIYLSSIEPVKELFLVPLEDAYKIPPMTEVKKADAYVVLGAGVYDNAPDIDGTGTLTGEATMRMLCAYRLYRVNRRPIIISGGEVFGRRAEAEVAKRVLLSLGVDERDIIAEIKSKDTYENAKYVKAMADKYGMKNIVVITNAYHMRRSMMLFRKHFKDPIAYPTGYHTSRTKYNLMSFLPQGHNMEYVGAAMKEYFGILFYRITL
ncbi:MAG: YdcF family protein [Syntrophorhabdaceae bacterium]|nr:YdcF family protein [Syntrophorhabdaceae bacterium]